MMGKTGGPSSGATRLSRSSLIWLVYAYNKADSLIPTHRTFLPYHLGNLAPPLSLPQLFYSDSHSPKSSVFHQLLLGIVRTFTMADPHKIMPLSQDHPDHGKYLEAKLSHRLIFVSHIPGHVNGVKEVLEDAFHKRGLQQLVFYWHPDQRDTSCHVALPSAQKASDAMVNMDRLKLFGTRITVGIVDPDRPKKRGFGELGDSQSHGRLSLEQSQHVPVRFELNPPHASTTTSPGAAYPASTPSKKPRLAFNNTHILIAANKALSGFSSNPTPQHATPKSPPSALLPEAKTPTVLMSTALVVKDSPVAVEMSSSTTLATNEAASASATAEVESQRLKEQLEKAEEEVFELEMKVKMYHKGLKHAPTLESLADKFENTKKNWRLKQKEVKLWKEMYTDSLNRNAIAEESPIPSPVSDCTPLPTHVSFASFDN
ncbi:hypothetical protein BT63DRAFT_313354 [Microthyrium microscopicum]|uniref:RRM domain-containing protein n=1 Tax=Microthyrium microscopicum TaxID=703497 RepID=A0A6A6U698_9PEZI|nr:hypothetical protein BT63DRAFT_313354 [Microthyrium microscopicum]